METWLLLILLLPLLGAAFCCLAGGSVPRRAVEATACGAIAASMLLAGYDLLTVEEGARTVVLLPWIAAGDFSASVSLLHDRLASLMAFMVTFVSGLVHLFSIGYMRDDEGYARYFCYLNLFVFFMLVITMADSLVFLFLGWEGVGFCSYALIGFWFRDLDNAAAGRKAFLLTRIGDVGFIVALGLLFAGSGTLTVSGVAADPVAAAGPMAGLLGFLLLWAAVGKSAQMPLLVWLPDAMAGPTPVSALIHAATMVTAGVYLLMRMFPLMLLAPAAMAATALVGAVSALYAAFAALGQRDIKKVLAYSTISQVGYMFLALGAADLAGSMFHLLTHAGFKALLFLGAGCVLKGLHEERDLFHMGGYVRRLMPDVAWMFLAGSLALAGIPPFAGFFSKGRVLAAAFAHPGGAYVTAWLLGTLATFLTGLYTFRLFFLAFTGRPALGGVSQPHRPAGIMVGTLGPLAFLAVMAGFIDLPEAWPAGGWLSEFLHGVPGVAAAPGISTGLDLAIGALDTLLALTAAGLAYYLYGARGRRRSPETLRRPLGRAFASGFGLDRLYGATIAAPYARLARGLWLVDEAGVDAGAESTGSVLSFFSSGLRHWTTGRLSLYLLMLLTGFSLMAVLLAVYVRMP